MATTTFEERKGWLTSLIPPVTPRVKRCQTLNARPMIFLKTPQISFVPINRHVVWKKCDTKRPALELHPTFDQDQTASLVKSSDEVSLQLSKDLSALTLNSSLEDITSQNSVDRISSQSTTYNIEVSEPHPPELNTNQQAHQGFHSHRRTHTPVHKKEDNLSKNSPRKYISKQPHAHDPQPLTTTHNLNPNPHLRPSTHPPISPKTLTSLTRGLKSFISAEHCTFRTHTNPFPTLDQNYGWTRAQCSGKLYFEREWSVFGSDGVLDGSLEEMADIKRGLEGFSLWRQREGMVFYEEEGRWLGLFEMVFRGEAGRGRGGRCWKRKPGSWYAGRKSLLRECFCCHKRGQMWREVVHLTEGVRDRVRAWRARNSDWRIVQQEGSRNGKRKFKTFQPLRARDEETYDCVWSVFNETTRDFDGGSVSKAKKLKVRRCKPEKVMSEQWRRRRREQEKKADRWTDGTPLQDRMWDQFYWVLDGDDPRENVWVFRKWRYRYYKGMRCRYWA